jgi:membrane-associated protease RseP (regulator of RpoE activity)
MSWILGDRGRSFQLSLTLFLVSSASIYVTGWVDWNGAGLRLTLSVLAILLAHEMGHYVAARLHRVDATLPFFLPLPVLSPIGTLGALILIRDRFPSRKALFDIGIAGPLAGLLATGAVLYFGLLEARVVPVAQAGPSDAAMTLGEPLLFSWAAGAFFRDAPAGMVTIGPVGIAAWFGLLLTGLNLIPIGQFDGGHVLYAVLRERAHLLARVAWWVCVGLIYFAPHWRVCWAGGTRRRWTMVSPWGSCARSSRHWPWSRSWSASCPRPCRARGR